MFGVDAIVTIGSMFFPPLFDLLRKKVLGRDDDTPEATLATLATTKPDVMPNYVNALAALEKARADSFARDVSGTPAQWLVTLRAAIRPVGTLMALVALVAGCFMQLPFDEPFRLTLEAVVGSWFGTRINMSGGVLAATGAAVKRPS